MPTLSIRILLAAVVVTLIIFLSISMMVGFSAGFLQFATLPLLALGLAGRFRELLLAGLACAALLLFIGADTAVFFLGYLALPALLFCPEVLQKRAGQWYPVGLALTDLAVLSAVGFMGTELVLYDQGGLAAAITAMMQHSAGEMDPALLAGRDWLLQEGQYVLIGIAIWWSVLIFYVSACLANVFLISKQVAIRPTLAITPFTPPPWILAVLLVCALASQLPGQGQFIARVLFIIFLLPYFFSGAMYTPLRMQGANRRLWLFMVYFFTLALAWPALIVAGIGIWQQCKMLLGSSPPSGGI